MVSLPDLWAPILLSAFAVFLGSSLIHMVVKWHAADYRQLPNEEEIRAAMGRGTPAPGQYFLPYCRDPKEMARPEVMQKFLAGPVALVYIVPNGPPRMGASLGRWLAFNIVISFLVAYLASRTLPMGTSYLKVFQVVGTTGFLSYAAGQLPAAIWMGKPWAVTGKEVVDGLIYGLLMAGSFGWLWPR